MLPNLAGLRLGAGPARHACVPTDRLVTYRKEKDWSKVVGKNYPNGPRFWHGCPDDLPRCNENEKVPGDPITHDEFENGKDVMITGDGGVYNPESLAKWLVQNGNRKGIFTEYLLTNAELRELGLRETYDGKIGYIGQEDEEKEHFFSFPPPSRLEEPYRGLRAAARALIAAHSNSHTTGMVINDFVSGVGYLLGILTNFPRNDDRLSSVLEVASRDLAKKYNNLVSRMTNMPHWSVNQPVANRTRRAFRAGPRDAWAIVNTFRVNNEEVRRVIGEPNPATDLVDL